ncbi:MAG TPA: hypothetical protein DCL48_09740, partial [Alphaproteobacteria bacterium]|nr:hypothetical protein [Alphaproteobacteria bacterium]
MTSRLSTDFGDARVWHPTGSRSNFNLVYIGLGILNLATIVAALFVAHLVIEELNDRTTEARLWDQRQELIHDLASQSRAIFEPANDVFQSMDASAERARAVALTAAFEANLPKVLKALDHLDDSDADQIEAGDLQSRIEALARYVRQGQILALAVMDSFEKGDQARAGQLMAKSDKLASHTDDLVHAINDSMTAQFLHELEQSGSKVQAFRYSLALFCSMVIVLVFGATVYGLNVSRLLKTHVEERDRQFQEIEQREQWLAEKNAALGTA